MWRLGLETVDSEMKQEEKRDDNNKFEIDLAHKTNHLRFFQTFKQATEVFGNEYVPLLKAAYYQLIGIRFRDIVKDKYIKYRKVKVDTRVNILVPIPSGKGKNNIKVTMKNILTRLQYIIENPTSYHPEQLVGKMVPKGKKQYVTNLGYLASDWLAIDEATNLLKSKDHLLVEARGYICIATDPIGSNEIRKRQIDNLKDEEIKYFAKASLCLFYQPKDKMDGDICTSGFTRRFLILYTKPKTQCDSIWEQRTEDDGEEEDMQNLRCNHFADFLNSFQGKNDLDLGFEKDINLVFRKYAGYLVNIGYCHSERGRDYTVIMEQTILDLLIKFSCLLTISYGKDKVTEDIVKLAFMDLVEMLIPTLDYVNEKTYGALDYGAKWGTSEQKKIKCHEFLYNKGALAKESSSVSIREFVEFVAEVYGTKLGDHSQAQKKYREMVDEGGISSCQVGSHDSRVWLTKEPELNEFKGGMEGLGGIAYNKIVSDIANLLESIQPIQPFHPTGKVASDEILTSEEDIKINKKNNLPTLNQTAMKYVKSIIAILKKENQNKAPIEAILDNMQKSKGLKKYFKTRPECEKYLEQLKKEGELIESPSGYLEDLTKEEEQNGS